MSHPQYAFPIGIARALAEGKTGWKKRKKRLFA